MDRNLRSIDFFIPSGARMGVQELFRARLVVCVSLMFSVVSAIYAVRTMFDANLSFWVGALSALAAGLFLWNVVLVRRGPNARRASIAFSIEAVSMLAISAAASRGYRVYLTGWLIIFPLIVLFLLGPRAGAWCGLVQVLEGVIFKALESAGIFIPVAAEVKFGIVPQAIESAAVLIAGLGIGVMYEAAHRARRQTLGATVAQLRQTHQELSKAHARLVAQEKLSGLGLLAAGIAHEINNPMAFITANISLMQRDLRELKSDPALVAEYEQDVLPQTADGIRRVNAIVDDLRSFARDDASKFTLYDLNEEIASAVRMTKGQVAKLGSRIETSLNPLPPAAGQPRQIVQVLMNLVLNAAQANGAGGVVRISSWATRDALAVQVEDGGVGMSREVLGQLFQPFFTTKPVGQGTGLGLAVAHGIVAAHGGRIEVESTPGQGSRFTVWLPIAPLYKTAEAAFESVA